MNIRQNLSTVGGISTLLTDKSSTGDCSYYGRVNSTGFGFINAYEGIPENLLLNLVVSAVGKTSSTVIQSNEFA